MKKLLIPSIFVASLAFSQFAGAISYTVNNGPAAPSGATIIPAVNGGIVTLANSASIVSGSSVNDYKKPDGIGNSDLYFTTGVTSPLGTPGITFNFDKPITSFGLLWGSIDTYNGLSFYNGTTLVQAFKPGTAGFLATGITYGTTTKYVNFDLSGDNITKIIASSTTQDFEFANVSYVPDGGSTLALAGLGLGLLGLIRRKTA